MSGIYQPKGAAREYSPLALNYIKGCDHGCIYCLDGETILLKEDMSIVKIKDVQIGDLLLGVKTPKGKKANNAHFSRSIVENKITTVKSVYEITLENGNKVKCSGDHRWLTDRGWKYTTAKSNRPFLTTKNKIRITTATFFNSPLATDNYKKGYLSGMIRGDGTMTKENNKNGQTGFQLRLNDKQGIEITNKYLNYFGIIPKLFKYTDKMDGIRTSNKKDYDAIKNLIDWSDEPEYARGFLAGIFDAEGGFTNRTIRLYNGNETIIELIETALTIFGFKFIHDKARKPKNVLVKVIRILGGEKEHARFFQLTNPAISRKRTFSNSHVKAQSKVVSIVDLGYEDTLYDITTSTETFIANGLISHNCYVPKMMKTFNKGYVHSDVYIKEESILMKELMASARKFRNSPNQVFLSFLTDPYSHFNNDTKLTRRVLQILLEHQIPVSILSKGGYNVLQDLDIIKAFGKNIQVGGSLTFTNNEDSLKWEKNGALPFQRFDALRQLHEEGVRTWASMEPVIYPEQSLEIMEITKDYIDGYKIGKLNHFPKHEKQFDWHKFLFDAVAIMRKHNKKFYIKKDLLEYRTPDLHLNPEETDMDSLSLKNTFGQTIFA